MYIIQSLWIHTNCEYSLFQYLLGLDEIQALDETKFRKIPNTILSKVHIASNMKLKLRSKLEI